jgi:hypothetical protein
MMTSSADFFGNFGEQMMQRLFIGSADIHAGPAADRLQPLQHLDVGRRVASLCATGAGGHLQRGAALRFIGAEEVVTGFGFSRFFQWFGHGSSCDARGLAPRIGLSDYATDGLKK